VNCDEPLTHATCEHPGWHAREVGASRELSRALDAARRAATFASTDLGLDMVAIRFFERGLPWSFVLGDPTVDKALVQLNLGTFDPALKGKACDLTTTPLPTVWVRAGLSDCLTAAVVLHEARHIWQAVTGTGDRAGDDEADAQWYMWDAIWRMNVFDRADVERAVRESSTRMGGVRLADAGA
jgi:hypothetical protein